MRASEAQSCTAFLLETCKFVENIYIYSYVISRASYSSVMTNWHRQTLIPVVAKIHSVTPPNGALSATERLGEKFIRDARREEKYFYRILSSPSDVEEKLSGTYVL